MTAQVRRKHSFHWPFLGQQVLNPSKEMISDISQASTPLHVTETSMGQSHVTVSQIQQISPVIQSTIQQPLQPAQIQPTHQAVLQPVTTQLQPAQLQPAQLQSAQLQPAQLQTTQIQPGQLQQTHVTIPIRFISHRDSMGNWS